MLKTTAIAALAAGMLLSPIASAQTIDLGGRGGPRIDLRSSDQRYQDRQQRRMMSRDRDRGYGERGYGDRGYGDRGRGYDRGRRDTW